MTDTKVGLEESQLSKVDEGNAGLAHALMNLARVSTNFANINLMRNPVVAVSAVHAIVAKENHLHVRKDDVQVHLLEILVTACVDEKAAKDKQKLVF